MEILYVALTILGSIIFLILTASRRFSKEDKKLLISERKRWNNGKCLKCNGPIRVKTIYANKAVKYKCVRCTTIALFTLPIKLLKEKDK